MRAGGVCVARTQLEVFAGVEECPEAGVVRGRVVYEDGQRVVAGGHGVEEGEAHVVRVDARVDGHVSADSLVDGEVEICNLHDPEFAIMREVERASAWGYYPIVNISIRGTEQIMRTFNTSPHCKPHVLLLLRFRKRTGLNFPT